MNIYVASSWKNEKQGEVVQFLRSHGHRVYDFKDSGDGYGDSTNGPGAFSWSEIDPNWRNWSLEQYINVLNHPIAERGFQRDFDAMKEAHCIVLVLPSGLSAGLELGWAAGCGKLTIVYVPDLREAELMVKMADLITDSLDDVLKEITEDSLEWEDWEMRIS